RDTNSVSYEKAPRFPKGERRTGIRIDAYLLVSTTHPALFLQVIIQRQCQKRSLPEDAAKHAFRSVRA
ncbi:hypothetical protein ACU2QB_004785, partial [Escherichia coli]